MTGGVGGNSGGEEQWQENRCGRGGAVAGQEVVAGRRAGFVMIILKMRHLRAVRLKHIYYTIYILYNTYLHTWI